MYKRFDQIICEIVCVVARRPNVLDNGIDKVQAHKSQCIGFSLELAKLVPQTTQKPTSKIDSSIIFTMFGA
jgi:hypothetical protein